MFTNHRWKRAKARHTAPKEQQGQEARILGKAWRSGLQGEQKAFSETTPNLSLHSFHSLDNGTGQRTQEETDNFPSELSCAEAAVSAPQSITANIMAATVVTDFVYNIVARGKLTTRYAVFSAASINVRAESNKKRPQIASVSWTPAR